MYGTLSGIFNCLGIRPDLPLEKLNVNCMALTISIDLWYFHFKNIILLKKKIS